MMYTEEQIENAYELGFKYHAARGFCPQCAIAALMDTIGDIDEASFYCVTGTLRGNSILRVRNLRCVSRWNSRNRFTIRAGSCVF